MDDIYGNLENYNEVNLVEELRNENKDLKSRLAEYASSLEKLQKNILQDFDKLSSEFNILETNYSSLLKTARAEIERKTQIITNLNIEKDMMVLKGIQNMNRNYPHMRNNFNKHRDKNNEAKNNHKLNSNNGKNTKETLPIIKPKNKDTGNDRLTENYKAVDVPSRIPNITNKETKCNSVVSTQDKNLESKENLQSLKMDSNDSKTRSQSIKNRRKSTVEHRIKDNQIQSEDVSTPLHSDSKEKLPKDLHSVESSSDKTVEDTQNTYLPIKDTPSIDSKKRPRSIKDRRKSMPVSSYMHPKFSSDEECEDNQQDINRHELPKNIKYEGKSHERFNDKLSTKVSESSTIEDRYFSHHESSRDSHYRSRNSKHYDDDKYSYRYDQRYRSHYSPDRGHKKSLRSEEYHDRQRIEPDDYGRSKNVADDYGRSRQWATDYGKQTHMPDDFSKQKHFAEDYRKSKYMADNYGKQRHIPVDYNKPKHLADDCDNHKNMPDNYGRQKKISDDYSRQRILESPPSDKYYYSRHRDRSRDNKSSCSTEYPLDYDRQKPVSIPGIHRDRRGTKHKTDHDNDEPDCKKIKTDCSIMKIDDHEKYLKTKKLDENAVCQSSVPEYLQTTSCQSPDLVHGSNTNSSNAVKEIMNIAETPLEDPRLTSTKYMLKTEDNKVMLSTVTGRNVDIIKINKIAWDITHVKVPEALIQKPDFSEQTVKDIYFDIDNPLDMLREPGEVPEADDIPVELNTTYSSEKSVPKGNTVMNIDKNTNEQIKIDVPENVDKETKPSPKYKIPKAKKPKDLVQKVNKLDSGNTDQDNVKHTQSNKLTLPSNQPDDINKKQTSNQDNTSTLSSVQSEYQAEKHKILSTREMVEGDLELSDESSDNIELTNSFSKSKTANNSQLQSEKTELPNNNNMPTTSDVIEPAVDIKEVKEGNVEEDAKVRSDDTKKPKGKKNKSKRGSSQESNKSTPVADKKIKTKKEKALLPQDIKTKFCDLFGDTTSLITPEDLGMPAEVQSKCSELPIFEDAQDANDINIVEKILPIEKPEDLPTENIQTDKMNDSITLIPTFANSEENNTATNFQKPIDIGKSVPTLAIVDSRNGYENINSEVSVKEGDVLKTVIISTGVQLQHIENDDHHMMEQQEPNNTDIENTFVLKRKGMEALATSTPHKDLNVRCMQVEIESSCNSSDSKATSNGNSTAPTSQSSSLAPGETPDVRIFVKRRKRAVKK